MAKFGFDTNEVAATNSDFSPLELGEYTLKALEAEMKETKAGTGSYLAVTFEVAKGTGSGRRVWMNFNLFNPSEKAQNIGRQQLKAWATAVGKPDASDSDQLIGRNFQAVVAIEAGTGGYKDSNVIKTFLFDTVSPDAAKTPVTPPSRPAAPPQKSANPWD